MTQIRTYDEYYNEQMQFIDRYLRSDFLVTDAKRLERIQQKQSRQSIHFLDDFLGIEPGKELDTTRIGYPPLAQAVYNSQQLTLAPDASAIRPENRRLSRYRLIYGPVDFYLGSQLEEPIEIPVITACAPNLMGSSQIDLNDFSFLSEETDTRVLKEIEYESECKKLAEFIVKAAKQEGRTRLVMPAFGVGVYIQMLNHHSKTIAREKMYTAFAQAALKYQINIDWIVWANDPYAPALANTLANYSVNNPFIKPVIHADMMLYTKELLKKQEKVVLLNPGSDRTIGGAYTYKNPRTLEEQIAQQSDLVLLHSQLNSSMAERFYKEFEDRKQKKEQKVSEALLPAMQSDVKKMPPRVPDASYLNFKTNLLLLKNKREEFKDKPECAKAYKAAAKLYKALKQEGTHYFEEEPSAQSYQIFKNNCEKHIKEARLELDKHRGFSKILVNILAIIVSAGIGYAIAVSINMAMNKGKCTFFSTDSSLKINAIEESIHRMGAAAAA